MSSTRKSDPGDIHIPGHLGSPICGQVGRTSRVKSPTCPECQARTRIPGLRGEDLVNPNHPIGRITLGSGLGLPGYPKIPGIWKRFRPD